MNKTLVILSLLAVVSALTAHKFPFLEHLQIHVRSLILQWCALFCGVLVTAFFKVARAYEFVALLIRFTIFQRSHREDFGKVLLASGSVHQGPPDVPTGVAPYALADMMRGILEDYETDVAFSRRRPETTRHRHRDGRVVMLINKAGWPVYPAQPGGSKHPARTDGNTFNWVDRSLSTLPHARPARGFFRRPRMEEIGRPLTRREAFEYELEMIQHIDSDGCMLKLCCEIGAEPERHWEYHLRVVFFLRGLRIMAGESSALLRKYDEAFRKGHNQFEGNSPMCAKVYKRCR